MKPASADHPETVLHPSHWEPLTWEKSFASTPWRALERHVGGIKIMRWYVSQNGKTSGPFNEQRIAMLVNWGKITSEAYLCDEKWASWVALTRSQFAPLLGEQPEEQSARGLSEPPGAQDGWGQRLALTVLIMLAAAAFLLAVWLSPQVPPGPLGMRSPSERVEAIEQQVLQQVQQVEKAAPTAHMDRHDTPV